MFVNFVILGTEFSCEGEADRGLCLQQKMLSVIRADRNAGLSQFQLKNEIHLGTIREDELNAMLSNLAESDMTNALTYLISQFGNCDETELIEYILSNFQVPVYPTVFRAIQSSEKVGQRMLTMAINDAAQRPSVEKLNIILAALRFDKSYFFRIHFYLTLRTPIAPIS